MKYLFAIIILSFVSFQCFSQRTSDLKGGIGYPYAFGNVNEDQNIHTINGFPSISIEKPIGFGRPKQQEWSINPGVSYYFFKETEDKGTETVGLYNKLNHHSLNVYVKWLYRKKLQRRSESFIYLGPITAFHIFTKTTGTNSFWGSSTPDHPNGEIEVNDSGINFYDLFYYGAVVGFQPNARVTQMFKPSFELKFFPGLVTRKTDKQSTIEFTLLLGYRQ
jgi:hypothetical protein